MTDPVVRDTFKACLKDRIWKRISDIVKGKPASIEEMIAALEYLEKEEE